ncbi:TIGR02678 family protein [Nocardiopsis sp. HNM0947]|uniref:TIGR02678 family protein n=1 Tax=Nocardiopsis coralli TaxID=2772213 RepID=A0ABR9P1L4_9ACTN|nr:TIGR02678 family protein [Nocardiopsis coralli]
MVETRDDMKDGIRALLTRPLLTREADEAAFVAVRRRREELVAWFDYFCGWALTVEPRQGYARLAKVRAPGSHACPPRPARRVRGAGAPFDRRRYTLFFLAAAELTVLNRTTIGLLARRVAHTCALEEGIADFDSSVRAERSALVDALLLLERLGALTALDGNTESYVAGDDALVLYRADTARIARLLSAPVPLSRVAGARPDLPAVLEEERYGDRSETAETGPSRNQELLWARHSLMRRLLDDPVVYFADLTAAEAEYAASLTGRSLLRRAAEEAGFQLEERAEGYLLADPSATPATDDRFPGEGHVKQTALLLLDLLTESAATGSSATVPLGRLVAEVEALLEQRPSWARSFRSEGGAERLAREAAAVLVGHGLAAADHDRTTAAYRALPAAHRYTVDRPAFEGES